MLNSLIPILGFAAFSGAGKTTLIAQILPILRQNNLRIGVIKHSHHSFIIDKPGKDSFRFREAGAESVMLVSQKRRAIITAIPPNQKFSLNAQLCHLDQTSLDIILVEGFKAEKFPKIEIYRSSMNKPLLYSSDASVIAVASDTTLSLQQPLVLLDLNQPATIAKFILNYYKHYKNG